MAAGAGRGGSEPVADRGGRRTGATGSGGGDDDEPDRAPTRPAPRSATLIAAKGHAVDNARAAVARLEAAFADGVLARTPSLDLFLADLMRALEQDDDQKLGGKSAEAARFILRAIDRELDRA